MMLTTLLSVLISVSGGSRPPDAVFPERFSPERAASWYLASNDLVYPETTGVATSRDATGPGDPVVEPLVWVLSRTHISLSLGLFDLRYPRRFLTDRKRAAELRDIAGALVALQDCWIDWALGKPAPGRPRSPLSRSLVDPDAAVLSEWIASWKLDGLERLGGTYPLPKDDQTQAGEGGVAIDTDLLVQLDADGPIREAAARFRRKMIDASYLDANAPVPDGARGVTLVLAPDREQFLGFASFVGSLGDAQRQTVWTDSLPAWTELHWRFAPLALVERFLVLALEYPRPDWQDGDVTRGTSMAAREKTGVLQHVLQHAARSLIDYNLGGSIEPGLATGMEVEIVIELLGENNARAAGSGLASATLARSKFVPGYTKGGHLPPINADSSWRAKKGRDFFFTVLRRGQREGEKLAQRLKRAPRGKGVHFALQSRASGRPHCAATAPFFGELVADKAIDEECASDYREFFRAYSAAFVRWLRVESSKRGEPDAEISFARLIAACRAGSIGSREADVQSIYGAPLSASDSGGDSLEGRFLSWLCGR